MTLDIEKDTYINNIDEISVFPKELDNFYIKEDVAKHLLVRTSTILSSVFSSYVERCNGTLNVICEVGDDSSVKNVFTSGMSFEIVDWVVEQKQLATLKLNENKQFIFVPVIDQREKDKIEHGMLFFNITSPGFELTKKQISIINLLVKITALHLTKLSMLKDLDDYSKIKEQIRSELLVTKKLKRLVSKESNSSKLQFCVLEKDTDTFSGDLWYVCDLDCDKTLVFVGQLNTKGFLASIIAGYLLGVLVNLKSHQEYCIKPGNILKLLNNALNKIFISIGISLDGWCGIFDTTLRKIIYASVRYPSPFLIWPEQHISNLSFPQDAEVNSLGVNLSTNFKEASFEFPKGSKLVICNKYLLEASSRVGYKYDPSWLPQVLETIGNLQLDEFTNSLKSILSENMIGTGEIHPRHALVLEIIS